MTDIRPNRRREPMDLWSLERTLIRMEPGALATKPRFGRDAVRRCLPPKFWFVVLGLVAWLVLAVR